MKKENAIPLLSTNRSLFKMIFLGIITLGIYPLVVLTEISCDINLIANRFNGKKTMHFCLLAFVIAPLTLGIGALVWYHRLSNRIGNELLLRGIPYRFSAGTFWGLNTVSLLVSLSTDLAFLYALFLMTTLPPPGLYWLWILLGIFLLVTVCPLIYLHKLCKAMNLLCADYNTRG